MIKPIEGATEKFGRCFVEKSEKAASLDTKEMFIVLAEQTSYGVVAFIGSVRSNVFGWYSSTPVYLQNLHVYHVSEDDAYIENMWVYY